MVNRVNINIVFYSRFILLIDIIRKITTQTQVHSEDVGHDIIQKAKPNEAIINIEFFKSKYLFPTYI